MYLQLRFEMEMSGVVHSWTFELNPKSRTAHLIEAEQDGEMYRYADLPPAESVLTELERMGYTTDA